MNSREHSLSADAAEGMAWWTAMPEMSRAAWAVFTAAGVVANIRVEYKCPGRPVLPPARFVQ